MGPQSSALAAVDDLPPPRPRAGKPTAPATLQLIRALMEAGTPRADIAKATGLSMQGLGGIIRRKGWQRLTVLPPDGHDTVARDQPRAPDATLTQLQHREAARQLRERVALILKDDRLGAGERGSMSKAALELARALTVAIDTERRCIGLDDPKGAGGRSPGVVIVLPPQQDAGGWAKTAANARRAIRRRAAPRSIQATVETVPPAAEDGDDSPDLDGPDDENEAP